MVKAKLPETLAITIVALMLSAVPAFAEFSSTNGQASGPGKSGPVVLEGGGSTLECASASGTGTILNAEGKEALKGPTLQLNTTTWNECKAKSKEIKEATPKVKACVLNLKQAAGESKAKGSVAVECTVSVTVLFFTCVIHVPVANGTTNSELLTNSLENSGSNLIIKAEDTGITTTTSGTCPGITGTKEAKQKATVTGGSQNWE
jgi:hypothetical protein